MPELPEVETVANGVHARVRGQRIESVWTSGKPQTFKSSEAEIAALLTGSRITSVRRVGKTIVATLALESAASVAGEDQTRSDETRRNRPDTNTDTNTDTDVPAANSLSPHAPPPTQAEFLIHLGMTGRLLVSAPDVPRPPHTHAVLSLSGGQELRFVDARRFGRLSVRVEAYAGPGIEPLTIPEADFITLFRGRKTPIKAALLNQSLLHGVGNIYADESLFRAGIRPRRQAGRLTRAELGRLRTALIDVLHHAIELGGSSVSDYVDADGVRGFFQLEHRVYSRTGLPCRICGTPIRKITVGGRSTHFCPICQR